MELAEGDHRAFRPDGWIEAGLEKLERVIPIAERTELKPIQLACQWNLAHPAVECVVPTLIQEAGPAALPIEEKRAELAALPAEQRLTDEDVAEIRAVGDNTGCMALKGASPEHEGEERPDRWALDDELGRGRRALGDRPRPRPLRHPPPERRAPDRRADAALVDPGRRLRRALHPDARLDRGRAGAAEHPPRRRRQRRGAAVGDERLPADDRGPRRHRRPARRHVRPQARLPRRDRRLRRSARCSPAPPGAGDADRRPGRCRGSGRRRC